MAHGDDFTFYFFVFSSLLLSCLVVVIMPRSAKEINRSCTATVSSHLIQIAETFLFIFSSLSSLPCVRACRTALQRTFRFFHMGNILCRAMAHCVCRANRAQSDREKIDMMILWTITCWLGCCHFCAIFYNFIISVVVVFLFFFATAAE